MIKHAVLGLGLSVSLTACETIPTNEAIGAALGGVGGGVLGNMLPDENKELWTLAGVTAGAFIGREIAQYLNEKDQQSMAESTLKAAETGKAQEWWNTDTGMSGSATAEPIKESDGDQKCSTISQSVTTPNGGTKKGTVKACQGSDGVWTTVPV